MVRDWFLIEESGNQGQQYGRSTQKFGWLQRSGRVEVVVAFDYAQPAGSVPFS